MNLKQLADLNKRFSVSIIAIVIVILLVVFSPIKFVSALLVLSVAIISAIGIWEYSKLAEAKGLNPSVSLMIGAAVIEVALFFISFKFPSFSLLPVIFLVLSAVCFFACRFRDSTNALLEVAVEFFGLCYVAVPLSFLMGVLYPSSHHFVPQDGRWWLLYLIVVTKITDVGAYFVGRLWGKHKLAPILSPKKTVEGAIAGFCCAVILSVVLQIVGHQFSQGTFDLTLIESIWLGMLIGVVGQVGDLAESLLKRDAVVKDSNTLPGLGGILDMVDSLLLTGPVVYFFIRMH
jgi:phosphatidate cytidylyltransferase